MRSEIASLIGTGGNRGDKTKMYARLSTPTTQSCGLSDLNDLFTTLDRRHDSRPYRRDALQKQVANRITDSYPDHGGAGAVQRLQQDEVLILGDDAGVEFPGARPNRLVGHHFEAKITDVVRFVTLRPDPARKCWRQVRVDEKSHGSEAVKIG